MLPAVLALAAFLLLRIAVITFTVAVIRLDDGNVWALLLVPVTAISVYLALWALRNVAAEIPRG